MGESAVPAGGEAHGDDAGGVEIIVLPEGIEHKIHTAEITVVPTYTGLLWKEQKTIPFACIDALFKQLCAPEELVFVVGYRPDFTTAMVENDQRVFGGTGRVI